MPFAPMTEQVGENLCPLDKDAMLPFAPMTKQVVANQGGFG